MGKELLCEAIRNRKLISFYYKDGERTVEPYLVGLNKDNHVALSAWFIKGYSKSRTYNDWKEYLLKDMTRIVILDETFSPPRPRYNPHDSRMNQIYCRV